jgi:hypothetical protein
MVLTASSRGIQVYSELKKEKGVVVGMVLLPSKGIYDYNIHIC